MRYHHIQVRIDTDIQAPYFTGSMIRGAFGHALKRVSCINPGYNCDGCFAAQKCLYYDFFERPNLQHKYRLDIELGSGKYDFGVYLFGDGVAHLPYVLSALQMALEKYGLGKDRITFARFEISVDGNVVYSDGSFSARLDVSPQTLSAPSVSVSSDLKITFLTPLRIKKSSQLEYQHIKPADIIRSIYQRQKQIFDGQEVHSLPYEPQIGAFVKTLEYKPLYRKSIRQGKKLIMDGVLGEMAILGLDSRSAELLHIGEIIGVGKQTVFGLGKIKVEEIDTK